MSIAASPFDDAIQHALATLLRVGTALVEDLELPAEDCTIVERAGAFEGVGRCVRQTVLLCKHVTDARTATETRAAHARREVARQLEDCIDRAARPEQVETLRRELRERMERPDFDLDLAHHTPAELIEGLFKEFGLTSPLIDRETSPSGFGPRSGPRQGEGVATREMPGFTGRPIRRPPLQ